MRNLTEQFEMDSNFEFYLICIWDIEISIGILFAPSTRDEFRHMWE